MEIILSPLGGKSLDECLEYLRSYFSDKEIGVFRKDIDDFKNMLEVGIVKPKKFRPKTNFYSYLLRSKKVTVFYEIVNAHYIKILLFWPNKKDPKLLEKLLEKYLK